MNSVLGILLTRGFLFQSSKLSVALMFNDALSWYDAYDKVSIYKAS